MKTAQGELRGIVSVGIPPERHTRIVRDEPPADGPPSWVYFQRRVAVPPTVSLRVGPATLHAQSLHVSLVLFAHPFVSDQSRLT